jgi:transcriptional regulator with XRE-family HTH domain
MSTSKVLNNINSALTPAQCRAARALLGWSQESLVEASQVAKKTIADFERGARFPRPRTLSDLRRGFESAGVIFIGGNGEGPGVRQKKKP